MHNTIRRREHKWRRCRRETREKPYSYCWYSDIVPRRSRVATAASDPSVLYGFNHSAGRTDTVFAACAAAGSGRTNYFAPPGTGAWCLVVFKRFASCRVGGCARAFVMTVTHLPGENNDLGTPCTIFVFRDILAIGGESTDFLQIFYITHSVAESSLTTRTCRRELWRKRSPCTTWLGLKSYSQTHFCYVIFYSIQTFDSVVLNYYWLSHYVFVYHNIKICHKIVCTGSVCGGEEGERAWSIPTYDLTGVMCISWRVFRSYSGAVGSTHKLYLMQLRVLGMKYNNIKRVHYYVANLR